MTLQKIDTSLNEKKIKEDDRLIRNKTSDYLSNIRKDLKIFEYSYRQEFLPAPTREKPFADKKALNFVAALKKIDLRLENLEVSVRCADSSLDDKSWDRYKNKFEVLMQLCNIDEQIMQNTIVFYQKHTEESLNEHSLNNLDNFLTGLEKNMKERQEYLRVQTQHIDIKF